MRPNRTYVSVRSVSAGFQSFAYVPGDEGGWKRTEITSQTAGSHASTHGATVLRETGLLHVSREQEEALRCSLRPGPRPSDGGHVGTVSVGYTPRACGPGKGAAADLNVSVTVHVPSMLSLETWKDRWPRRVWGQTHQVPLGCGRTRASFAPPAGARGVLLEDLPRLQGEMSAQTLARGRVSVTLSEAPSGKKPDQQGLPLQRPLESWAPSYH